METHSHRQRVKIHRKIHRHYVTKEAANAIIRVKDYGIGIAQEDIENVFERFYRVDSSRNRKTGGTGLGLSIAKSIVSEHHGKIRIASSVGAGAEVILHLPVDQKNKG
ncbi:sensor histidine kinase [Cohnella sp. GCM10020058]|uniref:sensor histidine kinase n=1 Tax=Cohnella sp. GCM10020058 TaxID=3317330 RepID=UPI0036420E84